jgi:hypothetical protein
MTQTDSHARKVRETISRRKTSVPEPAMGSGLTRRSGHDIQI